MIAVDTNILVHAHRDDATFHDAARRCVAHLAEGRAAWAIPWPCLHEFVSVVTHPRVFSPPTSLPGALDQVASWLESSSLVLLGPGDRHWDALRSVALAARASGPLIHDAHIAALCRTHGVRELWTADRDFTRFPELIVFNPLIADRTEERAPRYGRAVADRLRRKTQRRRHG